MPLTVEIVKPLLGIRLGRKHELLGWNTATLLLKLQARGVPPATRGGSTVAGRQQGGMPLLRHASRVAPRHRTPGSAQAKTGAALGTQSCGCRGRPRGTDRSGGVVRHEIHQAAGRAATTCKAPALFSGVRVCPGWIRQLGKHPRHPNQRAHGENHTFQTADAFL